MDPTVADRAFEPFFSTKAEGEGSGLGLATVQRIAKRHGGFVTVQSAPGEGTTVSVFFPKAQAS